VATIFSADHELQLKKYLDFFLYERERYQNASYGCSQAQEETWPAGIQPEEQEQACAAAYQAA